MSTVVNKLSIMYFDLSAPIADAMWNLDHEIIRSEYSSYIFNAMPRVIFVLLQISVLK